MTIGRWLRHELQSRFGTAGWHFDFGADTAVYRPLPDATRERSVCFIHKPEKPRRCARIGLQALSIVKHRMPDVKIQLYGSQEKPRVDFPVEHLGLLDYEACNALYNRAAVGLCLSSSNPSRIPFEMMAAGLPVVELWRGNTVHDFPDDAMRLCHQTPEAIAEGLLDVLADPALAARMSEAARAFMRDRAIAIETEQFCHAVERVLAGERAAPLEDRERLYRAGPVFAGERVGVLPAALRARLAEPPNARLNELPPHLRKFVAWGARTARRLLEYR
ncbi:rhamnosyltransferase WsaF family glycosyltransferase [Paraburkholderia lycopersici]|uniref:rhamnosyltransferase WsaF family glycosyltransferase n=1 Tax=Paraburkholderia lycopersici TaxID=416944 RepID=UPI001C408E96|nr:hypothetical protein [Paraburkholderia lycopersici]